MAGIGILTKNIWDDPVETAVSTVQIHWLESDKDAGAVAERDRSQDEVSPRRVSH